MENETEKKQKDYGVNSQKKRLKEAVATTKKSLIGGIILIIIVIFMMILTVMLLKSQVESVKLLNQYRIGSKALTSAVRAFAITGEEQYLEDYMHELMIEKSRERAIEGLMTTDITSSEWRILDQITTLSNGLVPVEKKVLDMVKSGEKQAAEEIVFGTEYETSVRRISYLTDDIIDKIETRMQNKQDLLVALDIMCVTLFLLGVVRLVRQWIGITRFAENELITPIIKVSEQLTDFAEGKLDSKLELDEDESEVGNMVKSINFMKQNHISIIKEISDILTKMGNGDFKVKVYQDYVGEYNRIKKALHNIIAEMGYTVGVIKTVTKEVDASAGQLTCVAEDLAVASAQQVEHILDFANRMTHIGQEIETNEKEAEEVVKSYQLSNSTLVATQMNITEMINAMHDIEECASQVSEVTAILDAVSYEVSEMQTYIGDRISEAIEKDEDMAAAINQMALVASQIQNALEKSIEFSQKISRAVENGIRIAADSNECVTDVLMSDEETTARMNGLVEKLKQETEGISGIRADIENVVTMIDYNSTISQEAAAVNQEQKAQVESLVELMNKFRV